VVANALAALIEIHDKSDDFQLTLDLNQASNLCTALNECSEWGQVYILEALMFYLPENNTDAESVIERVSPRLQHANAGVLLGAVKVLCHLLNFLSNEEFASNIYRKMGPPLGNYQTDRQMYIYFIEYFILVISYPPLIDTRNPIHCAAQHLFNHPKTARASSQRTQGIFCQVQ
jgi:vesicle coat complex subunit